MKSANDLASQTDRILDIAGNRGFTNNKPNDQYARNLAIMEKTVSIYKRYTANIAKHFGRNDGYISNADFCKPVERSIYMNE